MKKHMKEHNLLFKIIRIYSFYFIYLFGTYTNVYSII